MSSTPQATLKMFTKKEIGDLVEKIAHSAEHDWGLSPKVPEDGARLFIALGVVRDGIRESLNIQGETFIPAVPGSSGAPN
jgi:hypothetical protein